MSAQVGGSGSFYTWWNINFTSGVDGWVIQDGIGVTSPPNYTLNIHSSNPSSGVSVASYVGTGSYQTGTTPTSRVFASGTTVGVTCPATLTSGNTFQKWQLDGADYSTSDVTSVTMNSNHTLTAVYISPPQNYTLNIHSSNPSSGVSVASYVGTGSYQTGTTPTSRVFASGTTVGVTCPATLTSGNTFQKWQLDGADYSTSDVTSVTMNSNHTLTAVYMSASPTPTPTPTITLNSPNVGATWHVGTNETVSWSVSGDTSQINHFVVRLSTNSGSSYTDISSNLSPSTRSFNYTPNSSQVTTTAVCWVRAFNSGGTAIAGAISSGAFTIAPGSTPTPAPTISSISPNPVQGSSSPVTFTVRGSNFVSGSKVQVGYVENNYVFANTNTNATYINSTTLTVPITTQVQADTWHVRVINPDGQTSGQINLVVTVPSTPPSTTGVSPSTVVGSNIPQTFTVTGSNFVSGARVQAAYSRGGYVWNYTTTNATFVSSTTLTVPIMTQTTPDNWRVRVVNPNGQISSNYASFTVTASTQIPPSATTNAVSNVTTNGAMLNATVNPNGSNTTVHFEYGTTTAYGANTGSVSIGAGNSAVNQSATIGSLGAGTIYHYRVVATNVNGSAAGSDASFTTHTDPQMQPVLSVTPQSISLPSTAGTTQISVSNMGTGVLNYSATVTAGSSWLVMTSGSIGGNTGTISLAYGANSGLQRTGNVVIAANGANGSPSVVSVIQAANGSAPILFGVDIFGNTVSNWAQVQNQGHKSFAFIKASSGRLNNYGSIIAQHVRTIQMSQVSILVGAYHFAYPLYTSQNTGTAEAAHFLTQAGNYIGNGYLPPVLDLEDDVDGLHWYPSQHLTPEELVTWIKDWIAEIQRVKGTAIKPILYTTGGYVNYINLAPNGRDLKEYPLWIANYYNPDPTSVSRSVAPWTNWTFQQYATSPEIQHTSATLGGTCPGIGDTINPYTDLDSFNGDATALDALTRPGLIPHITSPSEVSWTAGQAVAFQVTATDSPTQYDVADLSDGLTINRGSGLITGAPSASGSFSATVSATNSGGTATAPFHLSVAPATPSVITSPPVVSAESGRAFSYRIIATNSPNSYSATGLPTGLSVNSDNGLISGIPMITGAFNVAVTATSAQGQSVMSLTNNVAAGNSVTTTNVVFYIAGQQMPLASYFGNISTRMRVGTGENVLIGGFIISGTQSKKVMIRGIGPSLATSDVAGALANPTLEIHDSSGKLVGSNDDWGTSANKQAIVSSQIAPTNAKESAILTTLSPGSYTAILRGVNNTTGVGLVEVYDLNSTSNSELANISTRGLVQTGNNVMIGGLIVSGSTSTKALIRAIGPSLTQHGITGALSDPTLELHNGNGVLMASNDNWKTSQQSAIQATGIPPPDNRESAILQTLAPGSYTAIVRGKNNTTGVALIEAYQLNN